MILYFVWKILLHNQRFGIGLRLINNRFFKTDTNRENLDVIYFVKHSYKI
jgi:hypothetical protein